MPINSRMLVGSSGIAITLQPCVPANAKVSGVLVAAIQNGGCGRCVGRGNDVTFLKLLNSPPAETFSSFSSSVTWLSPSVKRRRLSSRLTPNCANSCGRKARAKPTSSRPALMPSSMPISPASLSGRLNAGSTAPVISRVFLVRIAAAVRNSSGFGL